LEGAGVYIKRAFGYYQQPSYDPFLMLDDFRNDDPVKYLAGFPWHPHRGIETITYMLEGSAEHGDSLGNKGTIHKGEVQWMTAGSGIIHQEMPKPDTSGRMYGFQLWTNLPASAKMDTPSYRDLSAKDMPVVHTEAGSSIRIICGEYLGTRGPLNDIVVKPQYWDIRVPADTKDLFATNPGETCIIYAFGGSATIDSKEIADTQLVLFEDGESIEIISGNEGFSCLFLSGKPLGEPISWRGPIVMNTREEIRTAFEELDNGSFIKVKPILQ
jgi:hypothetical protein